MKSGLIKDLTEQDHPRLGEIPFQSERQYMATLHAAGAGRVAFVKGSPERMLALAGHVRTKSGARPLADEDREAILEANGVMGADAMRVIATGYVDCRSDQVELREEDIRGRMVLVGLSGMTDPPRPEAIEAVRRCKEAGVRVVMITGDNEVTARSVARQLGLPEGDAVSGRELQAMDDGALASRVDQIGVFARIEPIHKLRIVQALRDRGHVVATSCASCRRSETVAMSSP
jgi:Ca2+-transporting ATPase